MHPSSSRSPMTPLALGLGLIVALAPLALPVFRSGGTDLQVNRRAEDDRGSGRFSRTPSWVDSLSFRGSGRIDPEPQFPSTSGRAPVAYRGSGRITQPRTS